MLEKPDLPDERISAHLREAYGLLADQLEFLPLGADINTAVYRAATREPAVYFLKLRKGVFEEISVLVPRFLYDQGLRQIIPALKTIDGQYWARLETYTSILYPFIEGRDGYDIALSDDQWIEFGAVLKRIHTAILPPEIRRLVPSETFPSYWRDQVREFQAQVVYRSYEDPVAAKMAAFMRVHQDEIQHVVERAEQLARTLGSQAVERVLCHSDIHAGNLHLTASKDFFLVDWDNPILAPKEHDLMFTGGGVSWPLSNAQAEALFYQGYGPAEINLTALAYYRYERIVRDFAAYGEQILLTSEGGDDREQGFQYFSSNFLPNQVIQIAIQTDRRLKEGGGTI